MSFNDPFDCFPRIDHAGTRLERRRQTFRSINRVERGKPRAERRRILADMDRTLSSRWRSPAALQEDGITAWRQTIAGMGVLSLTSKPDDLLMWGHYAAAHTGFCLRFDERQPPFVTAGRVLYQDERPSFRPLDPDRRGLMEKVLLRKGLPWAYESEWRTIKAGKTGNVAFHPSALTGVILGARIEAGHEELIRELLGQRREPVELLRATVDHDAYQLRIIPAG